MKKLLKYVVMATVAIAAFSGCSKDLIENKVKEDDGVTKITCGIPEGTRTTVDGIKVKWEVGDVLYVSSKAGETANFKINSVDDIDPTTGKATFTSTDCKIPNGTEIVACHFSNYFSRGGDGNWYYDIPSYSYETTKKLSDFISGKSKIPIPVYAEGVMAEDIELHPQHMESMIRLKISNPTESAMTLKKIDVIVNKGDNLSGRYYINPPQKTNTNRTRYSSTTEINLSNKNDEQVVIIGAHSTETFDIVVVRDVVCDVIFRIKIEEDGRQYTFSKSNLKTEVGCIHSFKLALTTPDPFPVKIKIDDNEPVGYFYGDDFPFAPSSTIALLPESEQSIKARDISRLNQTISALSTPVALDLSKMTYENSTFNGSFENNDKLLDFYFPQGVSQIGGSYDTPFKNAKNVRIHLTKEITSFGWCCVFAHSILNAGAGFVYDYATPDEAIFQQDGDVVYQKDTQGNFSIVAAIIPYANQKKIILREGTLTHAPYALGNKIELEEIEFPKSFISFGNGLFTGLGKLNKLTFANPSPIALGVTLQGAGVIIIKTDDPSKDIEAANAYYDAWHDRLGSWIIKTADGTQVPTAATISLLQNGTDYTHSWY